VKSRPPLERIVWQRESAKTKLIVGLGAPDQRK
jgi:hypothetical protein